MRPRTKNQKEVEALRMKLPPINDRQKQWAMENCFENVGYVHGGEVWCSHCGGVHIKPIPELGAAFFGTGESVFRGFQQVYREP